jgi:hypothetical protein
VDGYSHHDYHKRDLQVSRKGVIDSWRGLKMGKRGKQKGGQLNGQCYESACAYICIVTHVYLHLLDNVFRL